MAANSIDAVSDGTMTITEATKFCGLGRTFLYGAMDRGELAFAKRGARRLIPRKALLEFLAAGMVGQPGGTAAASPPAETPRRRQRPA